MGTRVSRPSRAPTTAPNTAMRPTHTRPRGDRANRRVDAEDMKRTRRGAPPVDPRSRRRASLAPWYPLPSPGAVLSCTGHGTPPAVPPCAGGAASDRRRLRRSRLSRFVLLRERGQGAGGRARPVGRLPLELRGRGRPPTGHRDAAHRRERSLDATCGDRPGAVHLAAGPDRDRLGPPLLAVCGGGRAGDVLDRRGRGARALAGGRGGRPGRDPRRRRALPRTARQLRAVHAPGCARAVGLRPRSAWRPARLRAGGPRGGPRVPVAQ